MYSKSSSLTKVKVTASLDAELVNAIDRYLKKSKSGSRSQLIEDVLRNWHHDQKKREIERQVEEYYLSLSNEEREEDRNWNRIAANSAHHLWEE
jgi:metal-responsive CopG/Arc/MetJ family transcriptional regulator